MEKLLQILFPRVCVSCEAYIEDLEPICTRCLTSVEVYEDIFKDEGFNIFSVGPYRNEILKTIIHDFKYKRILELESVLDKLISHYIFKNNIRFNKILCPIPLHKRKEKLRGFNQAQVITNILEKKGLGTMKNLLIRKIDTSPQAQIKDFRKRVKNIEGAFQLIDTNTPKDREIILVDDVYTSGSTIKEARNELLKNGFANVSVFVIAKT